MNETDEICMPAPSPVAALFYYWFRLKNHIVIRLNVTI